MGNSTVSIKSAQKCKDNSLISKESISSFYDIITSEEEQLNIIYIKNVLKKQNEESKCNENHIKNKKIPTMFEWSFKGTSVYLTGSFCDWKEFFLMKKDESGIYRIILELNRGFHQYKFKIDDEWKYNINFPIYNDNGFINNYIDTSNWEIFGEYEKEEMMDHLFKTNDTDLLIHMKEKDINLKLSDEFCNSIVNYTNYIPLKNELNNITPVFPYKIIIDCVSSELLDNENKEKKYEMSLYSNKFMNEQINHFHIRKIMDKKPLKMSIISRFRLKFVNFVYYK